MFFEFYTLNFFFTVFTGYHFFKAFSFMTFYTFVFYKFVAIIERTFNFQSRKRSVYK